MRIEKDLNIIKIQAKKKENQNYRFRSYLKGKDSERIDKIVHELYEEVLKHIDCTECANCCIELETGFRINEIDRLTEALGIDKNEFITNSTKPDEYGDKDKLFLNSKPCQFLKDKKCTIYSIKPEECNSYPHLHKKDFAYRLLGVVSNYEICPIVYNVYELLKRRMNFK